MTTATQSYAASRNTRYSNRSSNLVNLRQRYLDTVAAMPHQAQLNWQSKLTRALTVFKQKHPKLKSINDRSMFRLVRASKAKLRDLLVDTTMQRELELDWVYKIILNFRVYQVQPIQVYAVHGDKWGGWDGQHTAIALYLISTLALGEKFDDVEVPINIYDISNRGEIRFIFISQNTFGGENAGKNPLDLIDIIAQMIYAVEIDGVTEPTEWVDAHTKWKVLKDAGMFLTASKFNDTNEIGAISRLNEIHDASVKVIKQFAVYGRHVVDSQQRAINTKEIPIIIEFLNLCEQQDIQYTNEEIKDLAEHCINLFGANFDKESVYWKYVHQANINAWNKLNKGQNKRNEEEGLPKHVWSTPPSDNKNTPQGLSFFWHQLNTTWKPLQNSEFKFPKQPFSVYQPDARDLF